MWGAPPLPFFHSRGQELGLQLKRMKTKKQQWFCLKTQKKQRRGSQQTGSGGKSKAEQRSTERGCCFRTKYCENCVDGKIN